MKLEYLDDTTEGGKYSQADPVRLIRLYDFDEVELTNFKTEIESGLIQGEGELIISLLSFVEPLNCTLTFRVSEQDLGVMFLPEQHTYDFSGAFSKSTYINMLDIIDRISDGYNWLYYPSNDDRIDLLLSSGIGSW